MSDRESTFSERSHLPFAFGGVALLGISLWVQLLGPAVLVEMQSEHYVFFRLIAYLIPIIVVLIGAMLRSKLILLLFFLSSFIPGIVLIPTVDIMNSNLFGIRIGLTSFIYIIAVSFVFATHASPLERRDFVSEKTKSHSTRLRIWRPLLFSFLFLAVLLYGVHGDSLVQHTIAQSYEKPEIATISISIGLFFVWCISIYMLYIIPALNFEHELSNWNALLAQNLTFFDDAFDYSGIVKRNIFPVGMVFFMLSLVIFL